NSSRSAVSDFNVPVSTSYHILSLHVALPICHARRPLMRRLLQTEPARLMALIHALITAAVAAGVLAADDPLVQWIVGGEDTGREDRKSTRLNSSHVKISYAVFCLKKKKERAY